MPDHDLSSAVGWQVSRALAESDGSTLYDYYDLGLVPREGRRRRGIIVVTSQATLIDRAGEIARGQGLVLTSVGDETALLARLHQANRSGGNSSAISAVFNVGVEKTSLMILGNGRVLDASQLMRGTGWLDGQIERLTDRQESDRHTGGDQSPHNYAATMLRLCRLVTREWVQALRVATHHCAELTGEPLTLDEVAVYTQRKHATPLLRAWRDESDIRAVDLEEAICLRFANEPSCAEVPASALGKCRIALLQASEEITLMGTNNL